MAQLWTDFQQTCISVARLGDILNTRTEVPPTDAAELPMLQGRITLDNVTCSYRPESPPVLNAMSLEVRPGEVIGILPPQQSSEPALRHSACPATNTWLHLVLMLRWPSHFGAPGKPTATARPTARVCIAGLRVHQSVR